MYDLSAASAARAHFDFKLKELCKVWDALFLCHASHLLEHVLVKLKRILRHVSTGHKHTHSTQIDKSRQQSERGSQRECV